MIITKTFLERKLQKRLKPWKRYSRELTWSELALQDEYSVSMQESVCVLHSSLMKAFEVGVRIALYSVCVCVCVCVLACLFSFTHIHAPTPMHTAANALHDATKI